MGDSGLVMPQIGTPEKRRMMESKLKALEIRAYEAKDPYLTVGEVSRRIYADCPLNQLSSRAPRTHWNNYRSTVQTYRAKLTDGDPKVSLSRAQGDIPIEIAEKFSAGLQSILSAQSGRNIFQACGNDVVQYGHGFIYVHPGPEVEWLNWFDVYVDNALTEAKMLSTARYIIINRYYDAAFYISRRGAEKLRSLGYDVTDPQNHNLPMAGRIRGREAVGLSYEVSEGGMSEIHTGVSKRISGYNSPFTSASRGTHNTAGDMDGLICEQEYLVQDEDSPSGWSRYYVFDGKIVESDYVEEFLGEPPIAHWAGDFMSGQFEQPALLLRVLPNQVAKTFMADKILQSIAWFDYPTLVKSEENRNKLGETYTGQPGEVFFESVTGSTRFLELPPIPVQYFEINQVLKEEAQDNTGTYNVVQGKEPDEAKSGVAIERLQANAEVFFQLLLNARAEFFQDLGRFCTLYMYDNVVQGSQQRATLALGEPMVEQLSATPDGKGQLDQFFPPGYQALSYEAIRDDMAFSFKVVPPTTREEKIDQLLRAVVAVQPISMNDPILAVQLAATITENMDIGKELLTVLTTRLQEMQAQAQQQFASQQQDQMQQADAGQARTMELEQQKAALQQQAKGE